MLQPPLGAVDANLGSVDLTKAGGRKGHRRVRLRAGTCRRIRREDGDDCTARVSFPLEQEVETREASVLPPPHTNLLIRFQDERIRALYLKDSVGNEGTKGTSARLNLIKASKHGLLRLREGVSGGEERGRGIEDQLGAFPAKIRRPRRGCIGGR